MIFDYLLTELGLRLIKKKRTEKDKIILWRRKNLQFIEEIRPEVQKKSYTDYTWLNV